MADTEVTVTFDQFEYPCAVAAVVHYALAVAHSEECVNVLNKLCPEPERPWDEIIREAKAAQGEARRAADAESMRVVHSAADTGQ